QRLADPDRDQPGRLQRPRRERHDRRLARGLRDGTRQDRRRLEDQEPRRKADRERGGSAQSSQGALRNPNKSGSVMGQTETEKQEFSTDQAVREASGAHKYGRYLEEFEVGDVYKHWPAKTITESEDHLFCLLSMNHHPLHINDVYAA